VPETVIGKILNLKNRDAQPEKEGQGGRKEEKKRDVTSRGDVAKKGCILYYPG